MIIASSQLAGGSNPGVRSQDATTVEKAGSAATREAPPASAQKSASTGPATVVEISDRAKAMLARNRVNQDVADRLAADIARSKSGADDSKSPTSNTDQSAKDSQAGNDIYKALGSSTAGQQSSKTVWQAGAPYGDPTKSDADFLKDQGFLDWDLTESGWTPEQNQAFKDAIRDGTIKFQKASEIEGLNFKSTQTFVPNANNGAGYDTYGGTTQNPTGDVKKALDSHRALAMWSADRGDIYLSW